MANWLIKSPVEEILENVSGGISWGIIITILLAFLY